MEQSIFKFIFRYSMRQQVLLLVFTGVSLPFLYMSMDLPKTIINEAIGGGEGPRQLFDRPLDQVQYLMVLCFTFLALVLVNGGFKYWINVYKGQMGERMLRRLRYLLYGRVLRFPMPHFRKTSQGELISMITGEVEPLGGFIGDALALPAFQGGTLLTILTFIMVQDPFLGIAAISLYPVQMYVIPKLQRRVNLLGKERVKAVRRLSERIGETVAGIQEVHANDTSELERADFARRVGEIFEIRYQIYRKKFFIKFLNNFIAQVTPFLFYSIGGYLVIKGQLSFGALVAVLAAYKDLASPWKELLSYYQLMADSQIKYDQLIEQFQPADMLTDEQQQPMDAAPLPLEGPIIATNVTLEEDGGIKVVEGATFSVDSRATVALAGVSGGGRSGLAQVIARLLRPTGGLIKIGAHNLATLPEGVTGQRLAYVGPNAHLFSASVRDNLYYGLKHKVVREPDYEGEALAVRERYVSEAEAAGNTTSDPGADWIDLAAAGVEDTAALADRAIETLTAVDLDRDIYNLGLLGTIDPVGKPDLAARILEARELLHRRLDETGAGDLVEAFDVDRYNTNMSVAENLLFGTPIGDEFDFDRMAQNAYVQKILADTGLAGEFLRTGLKVATIMLDLFQDLPPDHEFFDRYSFIGSDDLPDVQACVRRAETSGLDSLGEDDRSLLMSLPFKLIPARHRLGLVDAELSARLLDARQQFAAGLPDDLRPSVAFFHQEEYNAAASVQDNILFGKLVYGRRQSQSQVGALIAEVIDSLDLRRAVMEIGLDYQVGIGGSRMSVGQRQKLALARSLLKRPDLMVIDQATDALDPGTQALVMDNLFKARDRCGLIWVLNRPDLADRFERALVMDSGKVVAQGTVEELRREGGALNDAAGGA
ncbi:MAG: ATP-binding cassette domain-containing protein [Hyphomicrobiales bacterium]|nr:ATP-binding cassette domain-containing protein [Hyphomicrobiales bacterium]